MKANVPRLATVLLRLVPARLRADVGADVISEFHHRLSEGMPPGGARRLLYRAIVASARDARRVQRANSPREPFWTGLGDDVRQGIRHARRRPGLTIAAGLTIALAVALNTVVFTVMRSVLLRPLPFRDEARVGFVWSQGRTGALEPMSPGRALDLSRNEAFDAAALIGHIAMTVTGLGEAERWSGSSVSAPFFDVLGTPPLFGRTFTAADRGADLVVLSHAWWRSRFGGDRSVIGKVVVLGGRPRQIVGVMGPDFYWPTTTPTPSAAFPPVFWSLAPAHDVPERPGGFAGDPTLDRTTGYVRVVARLRAGLTPDGATAQLTSAAAVLGGMYPATDAGRGAAFQSARVQMLGGTREPLWLLNGATWLVVLAAATNVAGLFLVSLAAREREFAVRTALGARRWRLGRQCLAESLVIAGAGGAVGVAAAVVGLPALAAWLPSGLARRDTIAVDAQVFLVAGIVTLVVAALAAAAPMLQMWRRPRTAELRTAGTAGARFTARHALVGVQAGAAAVIVVLTLLMGVSLLRLKTVDVGFDTNRLLTFHVSLSGPQAQHAATRAQLFDQLLAGVSAVPGVTSAAGAVTLPIGGDDFGARAFAEGQPLPPPGQETRVGYQIVSPQWFSTLGVPVVSGRDFTPSDTADREQVVLVNESLARFLWPSGDAVGRRFSTRRDGARWLTVVGVVRDIHHLGPGRPPRPEFYRPLAQESLSLLAVAIRTERDPLALIPAVRRAVADVDPALPVADVALMSDHLRADYEDATTLSSLTGVFGLLALGLAAIGIYGAVAFTVTSRTPEFGVRAALGAPPGSVAKMVVGQAMTPVLAGAAVGLGVAWLLSEQARAQLFGVSPHAPGVYIGAAVTIALTGILAAWWPARRAARVDPLMALRAQD